MPEALQTNFPLVRLARDVMEKQLASVPASTHLNTLSQVVSGRDQIEYFLIEDQGKVVGVAKRDLALDVCTKRGTAGTVRDVANENFAVVAENTTLFHVISRMHSSDVSLLLVASGPIPTSVRDIKGVISREQIADAMTETISLSKQ